MNTHTRTRLSAAVCRHCCSRFRPISNGIRDNNLKAAHHHTKIWLFRSIVGGQQNWTMGASLTFDETDGGRRFNVHRFDLCFEFLEKCLDIGVGEILVVFYQKSSWIRLKMCVLGKSPVANAQKAYAYPIQQNRFPQRVIHFHSVGRLPVTNNSFSNTAISNKYF